MLNINILKLLLSIFICFAFPILGEAVRGLKILHLTFHKGCAKEFEAVAKVLGHEVTTWLIPDLPPRFFDGVSQGNALYNIGHKRAEQIWELHKETFNRFDAVLTSDTAPLARIFLQNGYQKRLIIWICCRFDYSDRESLDCDFPDPEFYELFNKARSQENVEVVAYTEFERYYAQKKGVDIGDCLITPCAPGGSLDPFTSLIPSHILKEETFFLPPYWNETCFIDFSEHCRNLGILGFCGRYNGAYDLKDFKGIIHLPYAWSNLAFFENIALGIPYFVPSITFLTSLMQQNNYWFFNPPCPFEEEKLRLSEWYQPGREEVIIYFDSWEDLKYKIATTDYAAQREKIRGYAKEYQEMMLQRWSRILKRGEEK